MKKLLLASLLIVSTTAMAGFTDNKQVGGGYTGGQVPSHVTNVQQALSAPEDTPVTLTGKIIGRAGDHDEFMFQDGSGQIRIEVEDHAWNGQNVGPNDTVTIHGKVDTNKNKPSTIDVYSVQKR